MVIGFIGFGEAAFYIAEGLGEEGVTGMVAYDALKDHPTMGAQVADRARKAAVELLDGAGAVVERADIVFSAVPSSYALDVCREVCGSLRQGQIYADVSASTPAAKEQAWELVGGRGVLFADAAMLGSLPAERHRVPIVASGNGAQELLDWMSPHGMRIEKVGENAGEASAIKLVRSIYMKGIASLMIEMLQAADAYHVTDQVVSSIAKSMDNIPFKSHLKRLVTGTAIHARRRAEELKGSVKMLDECGLDHAMAAAAKEKHELLESYRFSERYAAGKPSGYGEIIDAMKQPVHCEN